MFNYRPNLSSLTTVRRSHSLAAALALMCVLSLVLLSPSVAQDNAEIYPRVLDERSPPGGMIQLKVKLTEPRPITLGASTVGDLEGARGPLGTPQAVALFTSEGDVSGAAVVSGQQVSIRFLSRHGTFGTIRLSRFPFQCGGMQRPGRLPVLISIRVCLFGLPRPGKCMSRRCNQELSLSAEAFQSATSFQEEVWCPPVQPSP